MDKLIIVTFAFMGFAFYQMSGGAEFIPIAEEKRAALELERVEKEKLLAEAKAEQLKNAPAPEAKITLASAAITPAQAPAETVDADEVANAIVAALEADKAETIVEEVAEIAQPEVAPFDIREVTSARVNMRNGPGQKFNVVAKLTNGETVEILQDPGDGWVKLRVQKDGRVGWMADFLLTAANN